MPAPESEFIVKPQQGPVTVALEPAHINLHSMMLLNWVDDEERTGYGYSDWVMETAVSLPPDLKHDNRVILLGLHYAIVPTRSWPSFPAYINYLENRDPVSLRDQVFSAYESMPCRVEEPLPLDLEAILANPGSFLDYLYTRFSSEVIDVQIETEAYALLKDPPAMQQRIVSHLRTMWERYLEPEWERVRPLLRDSVDAFRQLDLSDLSREDAAAQILGQEPSGKWAAKLQSDEVERVIFVPSAHLGPYLGTFMAGGVLWLLFGARLPSGVEADFPDLSRSELLVRLNALADDTRLRILRLVHDEGERCSPEIIGQLELSQSAASRHLKQLSATGYLVERRRDGAKCYRLNPDRVEGTLQALSRFLLG